MSIRNPDDEEPNKDDLLNWDDDKWNELHKWRRRNPTINLKTLRINNFYSKIISELSSRISSKNIEVKTNYFFNPANKTLWRFFLKSSFNFGVSPVRSISSFLK